MSLAAACGWSIARSLTIAVLALPICQLLSRRLTGTCGVVRLLYWTLLLIPFFTPELLVGYAYSNYALSLVRNRVGNELLYAVLVSLKLIPLGSLMIYFAPATSVSAEAIHCHRLAMRGPGGRWSRWRQQVGLQILGLQIRGPVRAALPAFAVLFLLSFQEFEMASLMQSTSWTVWLFDAQAGGLILSESLRFAVLPMVCEAAVILPVLLLVFKSDRLPAVANLPHKRVSRPVQSTLWFYLLIAAVLVFAVPFLYVGRETYDGFLRLIENRSQARGLFKEILTTIAFAVASGILAYAVSAFLLSRRGKGHTNHRRMINATLLSLPGLSGSLVLSLCVLFAFQRPWLNALYDTPIPLILSSILFLLPRAILLQLLLLSIYPAKTQHLADLLQRSPLSRQRDRGHELTWQMRGRGHYWAAVLLCYWVYWDLTAASILSPIGMDSAPVRLYNLMHYGHNAVLSAMACLTIATPLVLLILGATARRQLLRWRVR
jgi:ABC-type Fe3+ transport system permease subunit